MRATDLKAGEHYAVSCGGRYGNKSEAVLVSTEPHRYNGTTRQYEPGRRMSMRSSPATYLVRPVDGATERVVHARDIVAPWAQYVVQRDAADEAAKQRRLEAQAQRQAAIEINQPKLERLEEAARTAGCSDSFIGALRLHNPASGLLGTHVSLDDLLALAGAKS